MYCEPQHLASSTGHAPGIFLGLNGPNQRYLGAIQHFPALVGVIRPRLLAMLVLPALATLKQQGICNPLSPPCFGDLDIAEVMEAL